MNLFNRYLSLIKNKISKNYDFFKVLNINNFDGINLEIPPDKLNFDLSSNIALVLAKKNNLNPIKTANKIKNIIININDFAEVVVAEPGFINIKLSKNAWINYINKIFENKNKFGSNKKKKKYNIEFVSANPTGPLHIGHCRGAIYGDVISNLLIFNGNKVTKEYYINDYGNQINIFTKSVYLRLREIVFKENFPNETEVYPGSYVVDIAKKIFKKKSKIDLKNF